MVGGYSMVAGAFSALLIEALEVISGLLFGSIDCVGLRNAW